MIESALAQLLDGKDLTRAESREVMDTIMTGGATPFATAPTAVGNRTASQPDGPRGESD